MPSTDYAGTYLASPDFGWQQQNPLSALALTSPDFQWDQQNPLSALALVSPAFVWEDKGGSGTIYYYQRVFSSGLNVWCYYTTTNGVNATPLSGATTPPWTGSIAAYELITTSAV